MKTANYTTYMPKNSEQASAIKVRLNATQQDLEKYIKLGKKSSFNEFLSSKPENKEILRQAEIVHPNKLIIPVGDFFYEGKSYQTITRLNLSKLDLSGVNFARVTFKDCQFDGT